jgi:outer membrane cobalamin receptor
VYVALKNVLNDQYSTVVGYPDYGFQAFIGLEYKM